MHGVGEVDIVLESDTYVEICLTNEEHNDKAGNDNRCCGEQTTPYAVGGSIAYVGSAVDTDRAWGDLTHGYNIHKLLLCHPTV